MPFSQTDRTKQPPLPRANRGSPLLRGCSGLWAFNHGWGTIPNLIGGPTASMTDGTADVYQLVPGRSGMGIQSASSTIRAITSNRLCSTLGISGTSDRTIFGFCGNDITTSTQAVFVSGIPSAGNQDWSLRRNSAATAWTLNIFGVVAINFTYDAGPAGADVVYVCTYEHVPTVKTRVWINGAERVTDNNGANTTDANYLPAWDTVANSPWQSPCYFNGVIGGRAWNDSEKRKFFANPWQVFAPQQRRMFVNAAAAASGFFSRYYYDTNIGMAR